MITITSFVVVARGKQTKFLVASHILHNDKQQTAYGASAPPSIAVLFLPVSQVDMTALQIVISMSRRLKEENPSSSSSSCAEQAASFLTFTAADLAPAVAAACQHAEHAMEEDSFGAAGAKLEYGGDRRIPLASWAGTGLGPMTK